MTLPVLRLRVLTRKDGGLQRGASGTEYACTSDVKRDETDKTLGSATQTAPANRFAREAPPGEPARGTLTERYELLTEHARGGLGRVLDAHDHQLDRRVAIKELLVPSAAAEARFVREAKITGRLEHPAIVPIHELGHHANGSPYYVMKKVAGRPLRDLIADAPAFAERLALVPHVLAVADAVAYAHAQGIIHRDLKPSNVIVGDYGETVVIDWGLAKDLTDTDPDPDAEPYRAAAGDTLTVAGQILGTPAFMPPEQARGEPLDERADVYALGAMLYNVLTGEPPYRADSTDELLALVKTSPPEPLARGARETPPELAAIVARSMARDSGDRYPTAREFTDDLRRFQAGQLVSAHVEGTVYRWISALMGHASR